MKLYQDRDWLYQKYIIEKKSIRCIAGILKLNHKTISNWLKKYNIPRYSRFIDLTGQKFGRLTIIKRNFPNNKDGHANWLCECNCGNEIITEGSALRNRGTKSCGCLKVIVGKRNAMDLTGKRYGRWTVIKRMPNRKKKTMWLCRCECGVEKVVDGNGLRNESSKSCGCLRNELKRKNPGIATMRKAMRNYKNNAKNRKLEWDLTEKQFIEITQKDCYYCGSKPNNKNISRSNNGNYIYNGIDRIDNDKGYIIDNIVPCCKFCNYQKGALPYQEFKDWIERAYNKMFLKEINI